MFFPHFYLPKVLYRDEREVWDTLAGANSTGQNLDPQIYKIFKRIVDEILTHANDSDYHPLDYPIVRYFLHPNSNYGVLNLPSLQCPEFIEQFIQEYDGKLVDNFFREITAQSPDKFYIDLESLSAVWQSAKYLKINGANICQFHPQNEAGGDVQFQLKNNEWIVEVKNLNHEDINLHCVAQMLAGLMSFEKEGRELRDWNHIMLEGQNIDDDFRKEVIKLLRKEIAAILSEAVGNDRPLLQKNIDGFKVSIYTYSPSRAIVILAQNSERHFKIKLLKNPKNSLYYNIGPSSAYYWPEPLTYAFYKKLDDRLTKIENQKKDCLNYLGFLHLELPYKYSNRQKEQEWQQAIKAKLNLKTFPVVLHTWVLNQSKGRLKIPCLIIINEAAEQAGFINKTQ
jgi:hypothetical protein